MWKKFVNKNAIETEKLGGITKKVWYFSVVFWRKS